MSASDAAPSTRKFLRFFVPAQAAGSPCPVASHGAGAFKFYPNFFELNPNNFGRVRVWGPSSFCPDSVWAGSMNGKFSKIKDSAKEQMSPEQNDPVVVLPRHHGGTPRCREKARTPPGWPRLH